MNPQQAAGSAQNNQKGLNLTSLIESIKEIREDHVTDNMIKFKMMYLQAPIQPDTTENQKIKWTPKIELDEEVSGISNLHALFQYNDSQSIDDA